LKQRGRVSAENLTVIRGDFERERPAPLPDLTKRQAEIWTATVNDEPRDQFATAALRGLLASYCTHRAMIETLNTAINAFKAAVAEGRGRHACLARSVEDARHGNARSDDAGDQAAADEPSALHADGGSVGKQQRRLGQKAVGEVSTHGPPRSSSGVEGQTAAPDCCLRSRQAAGSSAAPRRA
jgi:hypothetical protein